MKSLLISASFFLTLSFGSLESRQRTYDFLRESGSYIPWFTGALLPPPAVNAQPGNPIVAGYIITTLTYGEYDNNLKFRSIDNIYSINPFFEALLGFNHFIGVDFFTSYIWNYQGNKCSDHFQDTTLRLGMQLARDNGSSWVPDIRLIVQEVFPLGKFDELDAKKLLIDGTGEGAFQTGVSLAVQKLFKLSSNYLIVKAVLETFFPSTVYVTGFSVYGGNFDTAAKIYPGNKYRAFFSGEYSISQRWTFTLDSFFVYQNTFRVSEESNNLDVFDPHDKLVLTLAPEIGHSFTETSGALVGTWFSFAGKNSPAFFSAFVAAYYTF